MDERGIWEETHGKSGYTNKIFSLLDSNLVLDKFTKELMPYQNKAGINVLIPGCGSNVNLQLCCNKILGGNASIYALDWSKEAIDISKRKTDLLGIDVIYINQSYYDLSLTPAFFDIIIMSNAIVSESHENNVAALTNLTNLLKPNASLLGLFPSPFNMLDYALTNSNAKKWLTDGTVNVNERCIYEKGFGRQRFFSPLELYTLFKKLNCSVEKFETFFYDDENFAKQIAKLYDIKFNSNFCFWGYFINSKKI